MLLLVHCVFMEITSGVISSKQRQKWDCFRSLETMNFIFLG
jgi:hypothetical protein